MTLFCLFSMNYAQIQQAYFEDKEAEVKAYFDTLKATGKVWVHRDIAFTHINELIHDFKCRKGDRYRNNYDLQKEVGKIRQQVKAHGCDIDSTLGVLAKSKYLEMLEIKSNGDYYLLNTKYQHPHP